MSTKSAAICSENVKASPSPIPKDSSGHLENSEQLEELTRDRTMRRKRAASESPSRGTGVDSESESEAAVSPLDNRFALLPSGDTVSVRVDTKVTEEKVDSFKLKHRCTYVDSVPALSDGYLVNLVEKSISEARAESSHRSSRKFEDAQLMHLPLRDGGLRTACVNPPTVAPSLQEKCLSMELCAFCMESLAHKFKKTQKQSKKSKISNAKYDINAGSANFRTHQVCYQALERNNMFENSTNISIKGIYAYGDAEEDEEEVYCDICSGGGGLLFLFDIEASCTKKEPPRDTGWLAHAPCLHWLESSGILRRKSSNYDKTDSPNTDSQLVSREVEIVLSALVDRVVMRFQKPELNEDRDGSLIRDDPTPALSYFDQTLGRWRCSVCSAYGGVTSRCAAIGCTVRSHFLCATLSRWFVFRTTSMDREQLSPCAGFLCPVHCSEHSTA